MSVSTARREGSFPERTVREWRTDINGISAGIREISSRECGVAPAEDYIWIETSRDTILEGNAKSVPIYEVQTEQGRSLHVLSMDR